MKARAAIQIVLFFSFSGILLSCGQKVEQSDQNVIEEVRPFELPDILTKNDGGKVNDVNDWESVRREEILELFRENVYGRIPEGDVSVAFELVEVQPDALCGKAKRKRVLIEMSGNGLTLEADLLIFLPKQSEGAVPLFIGMNFFGNHTVHSDPTIVLPTSHVNNKPEFNITDNKATHQSRGVRAHRWPLERILERGYGLATIYYGDIDPDFDDNFQNGIHPLFYRENQKSPLDNEWGSIAAWAYGLSRAMDYFETDADIDEERIVLMGHSRLGKTALWAGALDQRFRVVISNNSGCGGAALSRRRVGEKLVNINTMFPHWFNKNFHSFNDREDELPVDQHMLLSLIAPRPVYVASAELDSWADPQGEYQSLYHAGVVYKLYGQDVYIDESMPNLNQPLWQGNMAYHIRSGGHDVTVFDWEKYMDFTDQNL